MYSLTFTLAVLMTSTQALDWNYEGIWSGAAVVNQISGKVTIYDTVKAINNSDEYYYKETRYEEAKLDLPAALEDREYATVWYCIYGDDLSKEDHYCSHYEWTGKKMTENNDFQFFQGKATDQSSWEQSLLQLIRSDNCNVEPNLDTDKEYALFPRFRNVTEQGLGTKALYAKTADFGAKAQTVDYVAMRKINETKKSTMSADELKATEAAEQKKIEDTQKSYALKLEQEKANEQYIDSDQLTLDTKRMNMITGVYYKTEGGIQCEVSKTKVDNFSATARQIRLDASGKGGFEEHVRNNPYYLEEGAGAATIFVSFATVAAAIFAIAC